MEIIIGILGAVALILLVIFYGTLTKAFVAYKFYYWFVIPYLTGLPNFNYVWFIGIILFLSSIMPSHQGKSVKKEYQEDDSNYMIGWLISPWVLLSLGWVIHLFI